MVAMPAAARWIVPNPLSPPQEAGFAPRIGAQLSGEEQRLPQGPEGLEEVAVAPKVGHVPSVEHDDNRVVETSLDQVPDVEQQVQVLEVRPRRVAVGEHVGILTEWAQHAHRKGRRLDEHAGLVGVVGHGQKLQGRIPPTMARSRPLLRLQWRRRSLRQIETLLSVGEWVQGVGANALFGPPALGLSLHDRAPRVILRSQTQSGLRRHLLVRREPIRPIARRHVHGAAEQWAR
mmetsp:Transcript_88409/g.285574  ORF Transcript_88409/g.285574 Transcript_88409/m.285574 type:complete len:233 (+) Transcript_88409:1434-2132(+)